MTTDSGAAYEMLRCVAKVDMPRDFGRLALVLESSSTSMTAARLRQLVPTFCVHTVRESVSALSEHHRQSGDPRMVPEDLTTQMLVGLDITGMKQQEVEEFAKYLPSAQATGTVYVMTPAQFVFFDPSFFDFVVR